MKKIILPFLVLIILITGFEVKLAFDFLQTLGINRENAENSVWNSFSGGYFSKPYSEVYKTLSSQTRIAMVKEIGAFAKAYTQSDDFKKKYKEYRESQKPSAPEKPKSMKETKEEYKAEIQKSISEMENNAVNYTGDIRKGLDEAISTMKEQLQQIDNPDNPMFSPEAEAMTQQTYELQTQDYQSKVTEWGQKYPESADGMIRERLKYFLDVSSTVDFNAKVTKSEYGKYIFVNQDYENQTSEWKMIFRAGKESTDAARQVTQQWMGELK